MTVNETLTESIIRFYRDWYEDEIARFAQRYPRDESVLEIDFQDVRTARPELADEYLTDPETIRDHFEEALQRFELPADIDLSGATIRFTNLQDTVEHDVYPVGSYLPSEIADEFTLVTGQVAKRTQPNLRPNRAIWECARCGHEMRMAQPRDEPLQEPHECRGCERQGPFVPNQTEMAKSAVNHQQIRLQRPPEHADDHSSATLDVVLERDLVKSCAPGDRVTVGAIVEPQVDDDSDRPEIDFLGHAETLEKRQTDFEDIDYHEHEEQIEEIASSADPYQQIIDSILPWHEGHEKIKGAIAYQLFGGVQKELPDGSETRGTIHIFLVGDPGIGSRRSSSMSAGSRPGRSTRPGRGVLRPASSVRPSRTTRMSTWG